MKTARKAAEQPDGSRLKQDFLNLEKRWLDLSRSFQLGEQLTDFTNEANRKASERITPFLQGQARRIAANIAKVPELLR